MWNFFSKTKHYTAEEVHADVIASTLMILERIKMNVEKATLPTETSNEKEILQELGLTNSKNMQVIKEAEAKINVYNSIIEDNIKITKIMDEMYKAFGNNVFYIPMKDFTQILDKYNLVVGRLEDYKGTIPDNNIVEISKAKKVLDDLSNNKKVIYYDRPTIVTNQKVPYTIWDVGLKMPITEYVTEEKQEYESTCMRDLYPTLYFNLQSWYRLIGVHIEKDKESFKRFPMIKRSELEWYYEVDHKLHTLLIAAPVQEMDTLYDIEKRVITDDPIVFSVVGNGVIVYSMWGDEGNDEVLKKYQDLNKFIAENVNLGTTNGSKEAIS